MVCPAPPLLSELLSEAQSFETRSEEPMSTAVFSWLLVGGLTLTFGTGHGGAAVQTPAVAMLSVSPPNHGLD